MTAAKKYSRRWVLGALVGVAAAAVSGVASSAIAQDTTAVSERLPAYLVPYEGRERVGTVLISNERGYLYRVLGDVQRDGHNYAMAYPVAIGEDGLAIPPGTNLIINEMVENPTWTPTPETIRRFPQLRGVGTVPAGPDNPMGLYSMVLARPNGAQTMWRIHGTPDESSIGYATSEGCVRMYNDHVKQFFTGFTLPNGVEVPPIDHIVKVGVYRLDVPGIRDGGPRRSSLVQSFTPG